MSLVPPTACLSFPDTNNHNRAKVIGGFNLFPLCQNMAQTSLSSYKCTVSSPLTHLTITSRTLNKRPSCTTRPTSGSTKDMIPKLEKMQKGGVWFTNWKWIDETYLCWFVGMFVLGACAPFCYDKNAFWVAVVMTLLCGFGLTLGYHRLLSHRSFKVPKWLEYFFAYCGAHAVQSDPIFWVTIHKLHHKHSDTKMDPYTPTQGVWLSHIGYYLYKDYVATKCKDYSNVRELEAQGFYRFLRDTYFWHPIALAALLYLYGGFPYLAWGMGVRITVLHLMTYIPFYVVHVWGERAWNTPDTSVNSWWVSMLCLGDGWHNNHHAFPKSARHGLEWWQLDLTWELIKFLEVVGLATDVKFPTEADKRRMKSLLSSSKQPGNEAMIDRN